MENLAILTLINCFLSLSAFALSVFVYFLVIGNEKPPTDPYGLPLRESALDKMPKRSKPVAKGGRKAPIYHSEEELYLREIEDKKRARVAL